MKSMPDGWLDYTPVGKQIEGTRFISFKVPLKMDQSRIADNNRLSPNSLLELIPNLGLIIDLTDTYRYYDPNVFRSKGIEHQKIRIQGRMLPPAGKHKEFKQAVDGFLDRNLDNDKLIGVHCTHGCNRTGLMICTYLINNDDKFDADKALTAFQTARGHEIHRENYVEAIRGKVDIPQANGDNLSWRQGPAANTNPTHQDPVVSLELNPPNNFSRRSRNTRWSDDNQHESNYGGNYQEEISQMPYGRDQSNQRSYGRDQSDQRSYGRNWSENRRDQSNPWQYSRDRSENRPDRFNHGPFGRNRSRQAHSGQDRNQHGSPVDNGWNRGSPGRDGRHQQEEYRTQTSSYSWQRRYE